MQRNPHLPRLSEIWIQEVPPDAPAYFVSVATSNSRNGSMGQWINESTCQWINGHCLDLASWYDEHRTAWIRWTQEMHPSTAAAHDDHLSLLACRIRIFALTVVSVFVSIQDSSTLNLVPPKSVIFWTPSSNLAIGHDWIQIANSCTAIEEREQYHTVLLIGL